MNPAPNVHRHNVLTRRDAIRTFTFCCGALLSGCATSDYVNGKLVLTQWYHQYGEKGTFQAVHRYAKEYTCVNPHIIIKVVWIPGDYGTKLATALLTPDGPDVFENQLSQAMVDAGQVAPLNDLFSAADLADFNARDTALNSVNGKIYAVKMIDDMGLLYYRKSQLKAAGLQPPSTMAELMSVAKRLTTGSRKGLYLGNDGGISALLNVLPWSANTDFLVDNRIAFDNSRTVASYQQLLQLNQSGTLLMGAPTDWWDPSAFTQGAAAMQWCGLWAYPAIYKAVQDDLGAVIWPPLDDQGVPVTFLGGWSAMVNANRPHVEEAKRFLQWQWIENRKIQLDWCVGYGFHVPPRQSLAVSTPKLQQPVPSYAVRMLGKYGKALSPLWSSSMTSDLTSALTNIVKLGHPAEQEIASVAVSCRRELQRELE